MPLTLRIPKGSELTFEEGDNNFVFLDKKITASQVAPTVSNDESQSFLVTGLWFDVATDKVYKCTDNTLNNAIWVEMNFGGGGGASTFLDLTDTPEDFIANKMVSVNSAGDALILIDKLLEGYLSKVDEGNGFGYVIAGRVVENYGNIGQNAKDISYSSLSSSVNGATGKNSFAAGFLSQASGESSSCMGYSCISSGKGSFAIGWNTEASGTGSTATGYDTKAIGYASFATGLDNDATGDFSHAEGTDNVASGRSSHVEGERNVASASYSHSEGYFTDATANSSHAEGDHSLASGVNSHAEGNYTIAKNSDSHAQGRFNVGSSNDTIHETGIGTSTSARKNGFEVYTDGTLTAPETTIALINNRGSKALTTKEYVDGTNDTTANRPTDIRIGLYHFDSTLNKPIWHNGTSWTDSDGTVV